MCSRSSECAALEVAECFQASSSPLQHSRLLSCLFSVLLACEIFIDDFNRRRLELFFLLQCKCTAGDKVETTERSQM